MVKPIWFFDKTHQGLSNAPTPKCFGPEFAHIHQFEYQQISLNLGKFEQNLRNFGKELQKTQQFLTRILRLESGLFSGLFWPGPFFPIFRLWIPKRCKGVHCVDLGESFPTSIYLQNLASIQPRTSLFNFN